MSVCKIVSCQTVVSEDVSVEAGEALAILQSSIQYHHLHIFLQQSRENLVSSFQFVMNTHFDALSRKSESYVVPYHLEDKLIK